MSRGRISPRAAAALVAAVLLGAAGAGWLVLVQPKRSEAARLDVTIADRRDELTRRRELARRVATPQFDPADLFRLAKAIPSQLDMPDILLQLNRVASDSGIVFASIAPREPVAGTTYRTVPIDVVFEGSFYNLSDFFYRLRNLVAVHDRAFAARGRLFSVERLAFGQGEQPFPHVRATLTVDAFVYTGAAAAATSASPAPAQETPPAPAPAPLPDSATAVGARP